MELYLAGFDEEQVGLYRAFVEEFGVGWDLQPEGCIREGNKFRRKQQLRTEGREGLGEFRGMGVFRKKVWGEVSQRGHEWIWVGGLGVQSR